MTSKYNKSRQVQKMLEIILIMLGLIVFTCSFFLPAGKKNHTEESVEMSTEVVREMVGKEVEDAKRQIKDVVDETVTYSMEKTERAMDRLTNEKMMAINEYSDTVLEQINKNHKEVIFLYDMLNDKHENLKSVVSEAVKTASEVKQTVKDAEITAKEAESVAKVAQERIKEAAEGIQESTQEVQADVTSEEEVQDFKPIFAEKIELPAEEDRIALQEIIAPKPEPKKTARKTKKTAVNAEKAEDRMKEAEDGNGVLEEIPEIAVSLNAADTGGRNNNERILELHGAGKSNMAIAKELGLGIGEVKLVIDLFEGI